VPKSKNGRYFQYVFGTTTVTEEKKEEIIRRINTPLSPEDKLALQGYVAELLDKALCGLGLESTGRYPIVTDSEGIDELEKQREILSEIIKRTSVST
jgi:hypothetical protein